MVGEDRRGSRSTDRWKCLIEVRRCLKFPDTIVRDTREMDAQPTVLGKTRRSTPSRHKVQIQYTN